jgi:hypothetical protein
MFDDVHYRMRLEVDCINFTIKGDTLISNDLINLDKIYKIISDYISSTYPSFRLNDFKIEISAILSNANVISDVLDQRAAFPYSFEITSAPANICENKLKKEIELLMVCNFKDFEYPSSVSKFQKTFGLSPNVYLNWEYIF